jgi:integrase
MSSPATTRWQSCCTPILPRLELVRSVKLTYSFARITAALRMRVEDLRPSGAGWELRLREKGGKQHWLFRTSKGWKADMLSEEPMMQTDAWRMIRRRAKAAGIKASIGCHTFRATGITAYLENGGPLEHAQAMAAHESPRTTKLYDRTKERLTLDEIERIRL